MAISFERMFMPALIAAGITAGIGLAAPAAAVQTAIGDAVLEDFEGYAPGLQSIAFPEADPDSLGVLSGGSVAPGGGQFPAASGSQVYIGSSLVFDIADAVNYSWPAVSFRLSSGDNPVQFIVFDYDPDLDEDVVVFSQSLPAFQVNAAVGFGSVMAPAFLTRFTLASASDFAIDDLQLGLATVGPGIPEPASWLTMLIGFGAVGIGLRRRRAGLRAQRITV